MRILLVCHDFLPNHPAGTEIYTFQLAQQLRAIGHDAHVFTTEKEISRPNLQVRLRHHLGVPVHELTNNLFYNRFEETWNYPPVDRSFSIFLDDFKPDVVHFMHLMYLSIGCVEAAHQRGLPVFFTLHDYWLQCTRFGQRLHADRSICHTIDFGRCGQCLESFKFAQTRTQRGVAKGLSALRQVSGIDLGPLARELYGGGFGRANTPSAQPPPETEGDGKPAPVPLLNEKALELMEEVRRRDVGLRQRLLPVVDRFIAPSQFLKDSFIAWGIPEKQILKMRTGIDLEHFENFERTRSEKLRFGFIGTVVPHKGLHILLRAWLRLPQELREQAELKLYGPTQHTPDYVRAVERLAERAGVRLLGALQRDQVPIALQGIDVLVVPSIWFENSPLIILEGLLSRTPLLVSDLGGMAELVEHGKNGYRFRVGDPGDLSKRMQELLTEPERLQGFFAETVVVRGVLEDVQQMLGEYAQALKARGRSARSEGLS